MLISGVTSATAEHGDLLKRYSGFENDRRERGCLNDVNANYCCSAGLERAA
jgi:hypothetical protein